MRIYKRALCFHPAVRIGLNNTGWTLKAIGKVLLLIVLEGDKNSFTAINSADGLLIATRRAGHCRVEVRGKGMQNKRKNTQQQDAALCFAAG